MKYDKLKLGMAIAAAIGVTAAYGGENGDGHRDDTNVSIDKNISINKEINITGEIHTLGLILIDSMSLAVSDVNQKSGENTVTNDFGTQNDAGASNNVLSNATGNIGLNLAAGDNNVQQNSTAIASSVSQGTTVDFEFDFNAGENVSHSNVRRSSESGSFNYNSAHSQRNSRSSSHESDYSFGKNLTKESGWDVNGRATLDVIKKASSSASTEVNTNSGGGNNSNSKTAQRKSFEADLGVVVSGSARDSHSATGSYTKSGGGSSSQSSRSSSSHSKALSKTGSSSQVSRDSYSGGYSITANVDASLVFGGMADAETFSNQKAFGNNTMNQGTTNTASLGNDVAVGAAGNIGINVAAGNSNVQANQLALASASGIMAEATAASDQAAYGNTTSNDAFNETITNTVDVALAGSGSGGYSGGGGGIYRGSESGTYSGISDQVGDLYPDIWVGDADSPNEPHPTDEGFWGHVDIDSVAQGAQDRNGDGGAFSFDENGTYEGSEGGRLRFRESGEVELSEIGLAGTVTFTQTLVQGHVNSATIGDNVLSGASGNIGVNIAAGTNNVQGNALAISAVSVPVNGGGGE